MRHVCPVTGTDQGFSHDPQGAMADVTWPQATVWSHVVQDRMIQDRVQVLEDVVAATHNAKCVPLKTLLGYLINSVDYVG